jgi:hypothetical protein
VNLRGIALFVRFCHRRVVLRRVVGGRTRSRDDCSAERTIFDRLTVVFVFQPTYVFAGVPRGTRAEDRDYPIVLRVRAVPARAARRLYLVILTASKVLVTGQWPNG